MGDQTYLPNKTVTLKEDVLNTSNTPSSSPKNSVGSFVNYSSHKTVTITIVDETPTKTTDLKQQKNLSAYPDHKSITILKIELTSIDTVSAQQKEKENYSPLKTVKISGGEIASPEKEFENKSVSYPDNKSESITSEIPVSKTPENYPNNKSHSFAKDEIKPLAIKNVATTTTANKARTVVTDNNKSQTIAEPTSAKGSVLGIVLSMALFVSLVVIVLFAYYHESVLKSEISNLQIKNADLTDSIVKLQKDKLHFDDIIFRGGKLDPKNNITIVDAAIDSEVLRVCLSINSNPFATKGKKIVYIRFIDPANNVLVKTKENIFEYRGKEIPFTLKEEVEYKNEEMMLCFDYKLEEKIQKGIYKAEIYNNGVLDGTGSFELK